MVSKMKIAIASDHAGYKYKEGLKQQLEEEGYDLIDFGTHSDDAVDYPDFIRPAARAVADGQCNLGIVLGGSGNGEAMVANREHGIRCAVCWNVESAELARRHNNANMLSIGQRMLEFETALACVHAWLAAPFDGGRHLRRIEKIDGLDN